MLYEAETPAGGFQMEEGDGSVAEVESMESLQDQAEDYGFISSKKQRVAHNNTVLEEKRQQAAASIKPGCEQWVLSSWVPKDHKPQTRQLVLGARCSEVQRRVVPSRVDADS